MPIGDDVLETGILGRCEDCGDYVLVRDDGGEWHIDDLWRKQHLYGRRVRIVAKRSGFNTLYVKRIEPLVPHPDDPDPRGLLARLWGWLSGSG